MTRRKQAAAPRASRTTEAGGLAALSDPRLVQAWLGAIGEYRAAMRDEASGWDKRYELLGNIIEHDPPLYLGGGYQHLKSFLAAEAPDESERTVRSKIRVARYFAPADEAAHGVTRLDLLLRYLAAKGKLPKAGGSIDPDVMRIELEDGDGVKRIKFADASAAMLRQATRELQSDTGGTAAKEPPVVAAVRKALGKAKLGKVTVSLRAGKLTLGGVDPSELGKVAKALGSVKVS